MPKKTNTKPRTPSKSRSPARRRRKSALAVESLEKKATPVKQHQGRAGKGDEDLKSEEDKKKERNPCYKLHHFTDLPAWMQDNPRLLTGYRVNIGWRESARSACHVHNETVNFWTHALSFVGIGITLIMTLAFVSPYGMDRLAFDVWHATHWNDATVEIPPSPLQEEAERLFAPASTQPMCPALPSSPHASWESDDVIERVKNHLPSMSRLTALLKEKADELVAGREQFLSFISSLESQLHNVSLEATLEDSLHKLRESGVGHLLTRAQLDVDEATHHILCSFNEFLNEQGLGDDSIRFHFKLSPSAKSLHSYMAVWPIALYVMTAMCCLCFSALFHLFQAVNQRWAENLQSLDYAGICLLISGSCVAIVYYGLYCKPFWMWLYITVQCVMGIAGTIITILLRDPRYRIIKTFTFIALGVMGVIPVTHMYIHLQDAYWFLWYLGLMGAMYLGGAAIYLTRVPEVWYPEVFDICGSSHQIWHILIVLAVMTLYVGLLNFFEWRIATGCPAEY